MIKGYEPKQVWYHPKQDELVIISSYILKDNISNMEFLSLFVAIYWNESFKVVPFWALTDEFEYIGEF